MNEELTNYQLGKDYEMYMSHFPEMDHNIFCILDKNGMKGKLWRGELIDLPNENIHIPICWWRNEIFKQTKQYTCLQYYIAS